MRLFTMLVLALLFLGGHAFAEAVRNGNELALNFSRADAAGKKALKQQYDNHLLTFRFLKVTSIESNSVPGGLPIYQTIEPSSDMIVILHPKGGVSRTVSATVATNDCLAVNGRLAPIGNATNIFVINPAVLRSKDRAAPKGEKELLPEIDPTAVR